MRRGRFLSSLEEIVSVNGNRIDSNGNPVTYTKDDQSIIIMEDLRPRVDPQGFVEQELRYIGNITPPNFDIQINDLITRQPRDSSSPRGASNEQIQVLTVEDIRVVYGKQQLQLRDRDRPIR